MLLASAMIAAGLVVAGASLLEIKVENSRLAQATPPLQSQPPAAPSNVPAEAKPGGTRPTTPAPEPASPDTAAQKDGEKAALPQAPAEKMAPPINSK